MDTAGFDKTADAVGPQFSIHVLLVIGFDIKRSKRLVAVGSALAKEIVKRALPTRRVNLRRGREHAIQVEKDGIKFVASDHRMHGPIPRYQARPA
jgi:hypothetical protein